jgi:hypothetical protein
MKTNSSHIAIAALFESARMNAALDAAAQSHLEGCDVCRGTLSWMQMAAGLGPNEVSYEPPADLLDKVHRVGRNPGRMKQLRSFIVAALTFDSFTNLAPAGVRRSEAASRQMTYEAEGIEIGLWVRRAEDRSLMLTGQVVRKSDGPVQDPAAHVDLVVEGDHIATSLLSKWGEFAFSNVPQSPYDLQVSVLNQVVRIPSLPLIDDEKAQQ